MFCKSCGKEIVSEAVICPSCGVATEKFKQYQDSFVSKWGTGTFIIQVIGSCFIPLIGMIVGIMAIIKGRPGYGGSMLAISLLIFFIYIAMYLE